MAFEIFRRALSRPGQAIVAATFVAYNLAIAVVTPAHAQSFNVAKSFGLDEIKIGALYHDMPGLWSGFSAERPAVDANVELLFRPVAYNFGGYLRPALGGTFNFNGETSKVYADLRWEIETPSGGFFGLGIGAAVHNGETELVDGRKALGSRILFHPTAELGYRFDGANSVSLFADHMSNGYSRRHNEGLDTLGVRFGHKFAGVQAAPVGTANAGDFSGFYIGTAGGYQSITANWDLGLRNTSANMSGPAAAVFAGRLWQSGQGVFGVEADVSALRLTLRTTCRAPNISCDLAERGLFSIRPRAGWVMDNSLFYITGGLAFAGWDSSAVNTTTGRVLATDRTLSYGVALGAGVEHKVTRNIGVRAEVLHYGVYGNDLSIPGIGVTATQFQSTVGRMGLSWTFN
jgi:lipid A 3-O-deacylase